MSLLKICASGILLKDDMILLGKRSPNLDFYPDVWDTIGGHCKPGETPEQTLKREIQEEIGVIPTKFHKIRTLKELKPDVYGNYDYIIFLVTEWLNTPQNMSNEHIEIKWFNIDDAVRLKLAHPDYRNIFNKIGSSEQ